MFEEVEGALYQLEDLNEVLDLQSRQLDHRFQLAMYKEKKLLELNNFKGKIFKAIYSTFIFKIFGIYTKKF